MISNKQQDSFFNLNRAVNKFVGTRSMQFLTVQEVWFNLSLGAELSSVRDFYTSNISDYYKTIIYMGNYTVDL